MGMSRMSAVFLDFAGWTSAHGIPNVGAAKNKCVYFFWIIIFSICVALFGYQMSLLVEKYVKREVVVYTEIKFEERAFPAITLCNLNPYQNARRNSSIMLGRLMDVYQTFLMKRDTRSVDPGNVFKLASVTNTFTAQVIAERHLLYISRSLSKDAIEEISYKLTGSYGEGFVKGCTYGGKECDVQLLNTNPDAGLNTTTNGTEMAAVSERPAGDFVATIEPQFGTCYTFNSDGRYVSSFAGPEHGLQVELLTNQKTYLPLTESAGMRVTVHSPGEPAFADAFGYNAAAGYMTSIGIKFVKAKRLARPYGDCVTEKPVDFYYDGPYSVEGCYRTCAQQHIIADCGCGDPRYKLPPTGNQSYCPMDNTELRECVDKYVKEKRHSDVLLAECDCPQSCHQVAYGVTVSTSIWPNAKFTPDGCTLENIRDPNAEQPWLEDYPFSRLWDPRNPRPSESDLVILCKAWHRKNTMIVQAFYERMNYQLLQENPAYGILDMVSDLGGSLGLWLGVSVISIIEFIFLLLLCLKSCLMTGKRQ